MICSAGKENEPKANRARLAKVGTMLLQFASFLLSPSNGGLFKRLGSDSSGLCKVFEQRGYSNLYHVTKFPLYLSFTVYFSTHKLVVHAFFFIHKNCFYLLIFYFEKFSTLICRLPVQRCVGCSSSSKRSGNFAHSQA